MKCGAHRSSRRVERKVHRLERADAEKDGLWASVAEQSSIRVLERGRRSRPYDPRWTPVTAISRYPASMTRSTSARMSAQRAAPTCATSRRNDAVAARFLAAGLHSQRPGRAAHQSWCQRPATWTIGSDQRGLAPRSEQPRNERASTLSRDWAQRSMTPGSVATSSGHRVA